jgi:arylsulfatase A-like enzyme
LEETNMDRREFIKTSARCLAASALLPGVAGITEAGAEGREGPPAPARQTNILIIVADDLGYAELGVQGCLDVPTPNIDSLARNGVRFTNGYVSCPVCSPTRAGLLTGRYQQRFGHEFNPGPAAQADPQFGLPLTEVTLAERLKPSGYATGMVGKWHLGFQPEMQPPKRGFDEFFGFLGGAHAYLPGAAGAAGPILRGAESVTETEYLTEAFAREAVAFIDRHQKDPFFLYLTFNAVHAPMQATEKYRARFDAIQDEKRRTFAAMLSALDDAVGSVLGKLRAANLEGNTLIFFVSDNGGPTPNTTSRNDPLRGTKGQVFEGGIRVPFLIQWKGRVPAGRVYDQPVIALDLHPTAVAAAGGPIPADAKLDGVNLLPYLTGDHKNPPHDRLFWRFGPQSAVRLGDWKLVQQGNGAAQLYNLAEDIGEKNDLAAREPDQLQALQAAYDAWNAQLAEPRWQRGGGGRAGRAGRGRRQRRARP